MRSDGAGDNGDNGFGQSADVDDNVFVVPAASLLVASKSTKSIRLGAPYVINSLPKKLITLRLLKGIVNKPIKRLICVCNRCLRRFKWRLPLANRPLI